MAAEGPAGPVQVNAPFREPLLPDGPLAATVTPRPGRSPRWWPGGDAGRRGAGGAGARLASAQRGLIIAGPDDDPALPAALALARPGHRVPDHRRPALRPAHRAARPLDGRDARRPARAPGALDRGPLAGPRPAHGRDADVEAARGPAGADAPGAVVLDGDAGWREAALVPATFVHADATTTAQALAARLTGSPGAGRPIRRGPPTGSRPSAPPRRRWPAGSPPWTSPSRARRGRCWRTALPDGAVLWAASSMPVRDMDAWLPSTDRAIAVRSNRGANGIDGVVSTALGSAAWPTGRWPWSSATSPSSTTSTPWCGAAPRPFGHDRAGQQRRRRHLLVPAPGPARRPPCPGRPAGALRGAVRDAARHRRGPDRDGAGWRAPCRGPRGPRSGDPGLGRPARDPGPGAAHGPRPEPRLHREAAAVSSGPSRARPDEHDFVGGDRLGGHANAGRATRCCSCTGSPARPRPGTSTSTRWPEQFRLIIAGPSGHGRTPRRRSCRDDRGAPRTACRARWTDVGASPRARRRLLDGRPGRAAARRRAPGGGLAPGPREPVRRASPTRGACGPARRRRDARGPDRARGPRGLRDLWERTRSSRPSGRCPALLARQRAIRLAPTRAAWRRASVPPDRGRWSRCTPASPRVAAPTLVIAGALDPVGRRRAETVAAGIPGARLAVLDGVGHTPHLEAPGAFAPPRHRLPAGGSARMTTPIAWTLRRRVPATSATSTPAPASPSHHQPSRGPQRLPAADRARAHRRLRPDPRRRVGRLRLLTGEGDKAFCSGGDEKYKSQAAATSTRTGSPSTSWTSSARSAPCRSPSSPSSTATPSAAATSCISCATCRIASDNAIFGQVGPRVGSFDAGFGVGPAGAPRRRQEGQGDLVPVPPVRRAGSAGDGPRQQGRAAGRPGGRGRPVGRRDPGHEPDGDPVPQVRVPGRDGRPRRPPGVRGQRHGLYYTTDEAHEGSTAFLEKRSADYRKYPRRP